MIAVHASLASPNLLYVRKEKKREEEEQKEEGGEEEKRGREKRER